MGYEAGERRRRKLFRCKAGAVVFSEGDSFHRVFQIVAVLQVDGMGRVIAAQACGGSNAENPADTGRDIRAL